jgi:ribosomal protein L37AE/L43A
MSDKALKKNKLTNELTCVKCGNKQEVKRLKLHIPCNKCGFNLINGLKG